MKLKFVPPDLEAREFINMMDSISNGLEPTVKTVVNPLMKLIAGSNISKNVVHEIMGITDTLKEYTKKKNDYKKLI